MSFHASICYTKEKRNETRYTHLQLFNDLVAIEHVLREKEGPAVDLGALCDVGVIDIVDLCGGEGDHAWEGEEVGSVVEGVRIGTSERSNFISRARMSINQDP